MTLPSWQVLLLIAFASIGAASVFMGLIAGLFYLRTWRHQLRVTDEWRRQHLNPDRPPETPFR